MQQKRIGVLIGGSGLIGGTIVNYYKTEHVDTIDIRAPSSKKVSIRVEDDIRNYLKEVQPDFVINSAMTGLGSNSQLSYEVNYLGPVNLARAAAALNIPYIHISSAATLPPGENLKEEATMPLSAKLSNYAKSKIMAETTLNRMAQQEGLDYSCVRLAIVYGNHDHKIQGFHRLLFSIADESMPTLFTRKKTFHSYSNSRKLPHFIHHMIENRDEFCGETFHFTDEEPIDLAHLILTIKSYLNLSLPKEIYIPYLLAHTGKTFLQMVLKVLRKVGLKGTLPPELLFLDNFYKSQTLNTDKLKRSSFVDPFPNETIFDRLPELLIYYLTRWSQQNLITTFDEEIKKAPETEKLFTVNPQALVDELHRNGVTPFPDMEKSDDSTGEVKQ